jgi:hypothetical protein
VVAGEAELRQLVHDVERVEIRLGRDLVAEADPVVEGAEDDVHPARQWGRLLERDAQLVVVVAHVLPLAPDLSPRLVRGPLGERDHAEVARQRGEVLEHEAEARALDHRRGEAVHGVRRHAVGQLEGDAVGAVRGGDARGLRASGVGEGGGRERGTEQEAEHRASGLVDRR